MSIAPDQFQYAPLPARNVGYGHALCTASMVTWAAGFPAAEFLLETWSPLALIAARLVVAVSVLIPAWALTEGFRPMAAARWWRGTLVGGVGFGFGTWMILVAQKLTDPVTVALIASCAPLAGTVIEIAAGTRRLTGRFVAGLTISLLGGIAATSTVAPAMLGTGAALAAVSVFLFAWGSFRAVRDFPDLTPLGRTTITLSGALVAVGLLSLAAIATGFGDGLRAAPSRSDTLPLLIYAVLAMALSQALWIGSVGRLGVALASFHINLAPFYVMGILAALGQAWDWRQAGGAAVVALGVLVAQARSRRVAAA